MSAIQVASFFAGFGVSGLVAYLFAFRRRRTPAPPSQWYVEIGPARKNNYEHANDFSYEGHPIQYAVAVRIRRYRRLESDDILTVGTVKMGEEDFDAKVAEITGQAEDRAAAMNAAEQVIAG